LPDWDEMEHHVLYHESQTHLLFTTTNSGPDQALHITSRVV
jgi:hypothetical protein